MERDIYFRYYTITYQKLENKEWIDKGGYNLSDLLIRVENSGNIKKLKDLSNGKRVRLETFDYNKDSDCWEAQFIRKRAIVPSKCKEQEAATEIELAPDEYMGEGIAILYDKNKNIVMMQVNRNALTNKALQEWIRKMHKECYNGENIRVTLAVKLKNDINYYFRNKIVKRLDVDISDVNEGIHENASLGRMIRMKNIFHGKKMRLQINVSRDRDAQLNEDEVQNLVDDVMNNDTGIDRVYIGYKEDDESGVEGVDLIDEVLMDKITINQEDKKPLNYQQLKYKMINTYNERKSQF